MLTSLERGLVTTIANVLSDPTACGSTNNRGSALVIQAAINGKRQDIRFDDFSKTYLGELSDEDRQKAVSELFADRATWPDGKTEVQCQSLLHRKILFVLVDNVAASRRRVEILSS